MARTACLWAMLFLYALARLSQLYTDRLPTLVVVLVHVVPPAVFALVHGAALYGRKGIATFAVLCVGIGSLAETLSLRTGFPFGRNHFTDLMGPKILDLPILLALAYLGIGYVSWTLAALIAPVRPIATPLLASVLMTAWDLSMDPNWSTLYQAWIWHDGGPYFGVPVSNFLGWFATAYVYYQVFALYCRKTPPHPMPTTLWTPPILLYAVCATGNLLTFGIPILPSVATDGAGHSWVASRVLTNCAAVSLLVMMPFAVLAWRRSLTASSYRPASTGPTSPAALRSLPPRT